MQFLSVSSPYDTVWNELQPEQTTPPQRTSTHTLYSLPAVRCDWDKKNREVLLPRRMLVSGLLVLVSLNRRAEESHDCCQRTNTPSEPTTCSFTAVSPSSTQTGATEEITEGELCWDIACSVVGCEQQRLHVTVSDRVLSPECSV